MDILTFVNQRYTWREKPFTRDTLFYRWQSPIFTLDEKEGRFYIAGNPCSGSPIFDIYAAKRKDRSKSIRGKSLADPGIGVTDCFVGDYSTHGTLNLQMRLGDVLDVGGKIYPYDLAGPNEWYLTIPQGQTVSVIPHACQSKVSEFDLQPVTLAKLGVAYNRVTAGLGFLCINVCNWQDEHHENFKAKLYEKEGIDWTETSSLEYEIKSGRMVIRGQTHHSTMDSSVIGSALLSRMMLKHPEQTQICAPKHIADYLSPFLHELELDNVYALSRR
ncbi:hypothetical protein HZB02_07135 [Candidatus Woesearchaeota archaeon]|nr:hypothetical protein [Candidatus Woesearchaeota archaeon]